MTLSNIPAKPTTQTIPPRSTFPVECVNVACCKADLRLARICIASIRYWYPTVPIFLIKDTHQGDFDTAEIENSWAISILPTKRQNYGWGFSKLEAIFNPTSKRTLVLDADTALIGPVFDAVQNIDADFICPAELASGPYDANIRSNYYNWNRLSFLDPNFQFPGYCFNSGQFFVKGGTLSEHQFTSTVEWSQPPRHKIPGIFFPGEQGILNYVVPRASQEGKLNVRFADFARWASDRNLPAIDLSRIKSHIGDPLVLHWAGPKSPIIAQMVRSEVLRFYETFYYSRTPSSSRKHLLPRTFSLLPLLAKTSQKTALQRLQNANRRFSLLFSQLSESAAARTVVGNPLAWKLLNAAVIKPSEAMRTARRLHRKEQLLSRLQAKGRVLGGPFAGMLIPRSLDSIPSSIPKLLGTYGAELHPVIHELITLKPNLLLDIGCAEGFFAVGMAIQCPETHVIAVESNIDLLVRARELASRNEVHSRLDFHQAYSAALLSTQAPKHKTVLYCTTSATNLNFSLKEQTSYLSSVFLIIEIEGHLGSPFTQAIVRMLSPTHRCELLHALSNEARACTYASPDVNSDDTLEANIAFAEDRSPLLNWLIARPRGV